MKRSSLRACSLTCDTWGCGHVCWAGCAGHAVGVTESRAERREHTRDVTVSRTARAHLVLQGPTCHSTFQRHSHSSGRRLQTHGQRRRRGTQLCRKLVGKFLNGCKADRYSHCVSPPVLYIQEPPNGGSGSGGTRKEGENKTATRGGVTAVLPGTWTRCKAN